MLTLINKRKHPPGGWRYKCPKCKWQVPEPLQSHGIVVEQIKKHWTSNPAHALNANDAKHLMEAYTCKRLGDGAWCKDMDAEMAAAHVRAQEPSTCEGCVRKRKKP